MSDLDYKMLCNFLGKESKEETLRSMSASNKKLDEIATLLIKVASGAIGLLGAWILTNAKLLLPLSRISILIFILSSVPGIIQLYRDALFFEEHGKVSRDITTHANLYANGDNEEDHLVKIRDLLNKKTRMGDATSLWPLSLQIILIAIGTILPLYELIIKPLI